jgi:predicted DCC family thiol-disulfide oxidoreductase YuxK
VVAADEPAAVTDAGPPAASRRAWLTRAFLSIDPRSLGLGRIALALVLLLDLVHRALGGVALWYSNLGLLPNHTVLWRPPAPWIFSLFFMASWPDEAALGFVLCGLVYLALLVGWRTRLMQALSVVAVLSLHGRTTFLETGGDRMLRALALTTAFLPLGRRFSVDAVRASLRRRDVEETTAASLNDRAARARDVTPVVSLAALAVVLQLATASLFGALDAGGPWAARAIEISLPVLILAPVARPWLRRAALVACLGLATGARRFTHFGIPSFAMMAFTPYLLSPADWALFARWASRRARRLTVSFDAGCGVCFQIARGLARLDPLARLTFRSSDDEAARPPGVTSALLARTIVVVDEATGAVTTRADGLARILGALPGGLLWALPLRLPGLRQLANLTYDAFAARRQTVSLWLGLAACGAPRAAPPLRPRPDPEPPPVRQWGRRATSVARELVVAALVVTLLMRARSTFATDAPMAHERVAVDAVTLDGRHVEVIPPRLDDDPFFSSYAARIPFEADYFTAFQEWILRYPERTGRPEDTIVKFDVWMVEDPSPAHGHGDERDRQGHVFLSWAKK